MAQPTSPERDANESIDLALVEAMERMADGDAHALEAVCRAHPSLADEIRERLGVLREMNLLPTDAAAMAFPSHLGQFRLLRRLGGGGMGVVYEAVREPQGQRVALKLIRPEQLYFPRARERFRRETEAVARLSHPGIVAILAVGEAQETPYFAMEMVHGASLAQALDQLSGSAPEHLNASDLRATAMAATPQALIEVTDEVPELFRGTWVDAATRVAIRLCEALAHAHGRGILHRDIKPSNVVVTPTGRVVLLDFGLAGLESELRITMSGTTLGSMLYMAPEQVAGRVEEIDARTDVYSLGVTLYELLTLKLPYESRDAELARAAILDGHPPSLRARNPEIGRDLEVVCLKAIERERSRRYASMAEFGADLERALAGRPIVAQPPSAAYRAWRWIRRHPTTSTAAALGALLVFSLPTALYLQQRAHARRLQVVLDDAIAAREQADAASKRANQIAREAESVSSFLGGLLAAGDPYSPDSSGQRELTASQLLALGVERASNSLTDDPDLQASVLERIALTYMNTDHYGDAVAPLEHALELRRGVHGDDDARTAMTKVSLASARRLTGRPGAVALLREGLPVLARAPEIDAAKLLEMRNLLALSLIDEGEHDEPLAMLRETRRVLGQIEIKDRAVRWSVQSMTASGLQRLEAYAEAEDLARTTLAGSGEISIRTHPWHAAMLDVLSNCLRGQGRMQEACAVYDELLPIAAQLYESDNPVLLTMRDNAALTRAEVGELDDVEDTLRNSYAKLSERAGLDDKNTLNALNALTYFLVLHDRTDEGLDVLVDALSRLESQAGASSPTVARVLERVGVLQGARGDDRAAEQTLRRARAMAVAGQDVTIDLALATTLVRDAQRRAEAVALAEPWTGHWRSSNALAAHYVLARAAFAAGELDEAQRIARAALELPGAKSGLSWAASGCQAVLGAVQIARGDATAGRRAVDDALDHMAQRLGAAHATVSEARAAFAR